MSPKLYFFRNIPFLFNSTISLEEKLKIAVNNTGNYFYEHAVSNQIDGIEIIDSLDLFIEPDSILVLSMSNFISPFTDLGDFALDIEKKKFSKVIMIGAGAQAYDYSEKIILKDGTKNFLSLISERSNSIGVRGQYTAEILNQFGYKNIDIIGCPSIFMNCDPDFQVATNIPFRNDLASSFNFTPVGFFRDKISELIAFGILNCHSFVAQSETDLLGLYSDSAVHKNNLDFFFSYYSNPKISASIAHEWFKLNTHWFFNLNDWFNFSSKLNFSIGSRFHGNMASILHGIPALNLTFDTRTRELCEYLNLPFMHLSDFDSNMSLSFLYEYADFSFFNSTYLLKYTNYHNFLIKNNLNSKLLFFPSADYPSQKNSIVSKSLSLLINDAFSQDCIAPSLLRELDLRLRTDRCINTRLSIEAG